LGSLKKTEAMLMKRMNGLLFFLLLFEAIGCSWNLESPEMFRQQKNENDSFR